MFFQECELVRGICSRHQLCRDGTVGHTLDEPKFQLVRCTILALLRNMRISSRTFVFSLNYFKGASVIGSSLDACCSNGIHAVEARYFLKILKAVLSFPICLVKRLAHLGTEWMKEQILPSSLIYRQLSVPHCARHQLHNHCSRRRFLVELILYHRARNLYLVRRKLWRLCVLCGLFLRATVGAWHALRLYQYFYDAKDYVQ